MKLYAYGNNINRESGERLAVVDSNENAEFIAKACNAHAQLVEALKAMLDQYNEQTVTGMVHDEFMACIKAREALKAAGVL